MGADPVTDAILSAALELLGKSGYDALRLRAVAERAGVSRPTLYARFANKEDLCRGVVRSVFEAATSRVAAVVDRGGELADVLEAMLCNYFGDLYDMVLALERADDIMVMQERIASDILADARNHMQRQLERALRAGGDSNVVSRAALVRMLLQAPRAFKQPGMSSKAYRRELRNLARVVAHAAS